jgi:hypothetical protein
VGQHHAEIRRDRDLNQVGRVDRADQHDPAEQRGRDVVRVATGDCRFRLQAHGKERDAIERVAQ